MSCATSNYCRIIRKDGILSLQNKDSALEQLAARFLDRLRVRCLSPKTIRAYSYDLVYFFRWLKSIGRHISEFTYQELYEYLKHQVDLGAKPRSMNRRLVVCGLFIDFLHDQGIPVHPTHLKSGTFPVPRRRWGRYPTKRGSPSVRVKVPFDIVNPLETEEVNRLLKKSKRYRDLSIVLLMAMVGLRCAEVLAIAIGNIDFVKNIILIKGKGKKERVMPLPEMLLGSLSKYLHCERPRSAVTDKLFVILQGPDRGKPMTEEGLRSLFRRRRSSTRVYHGNPHRLRHTFASNMVRSGVSLIVLQQMMGHAHYATTTRYASLRVEDIAKEYLAAMKTIESRHAERVS